MHEEPECCHREFISYKTIDRTQFRSGFLNPTVQTTGIAAHYCVSPQPWKGQKQALLVTPSPQFGSSWILRQSGARIPQVISNFHTSKLVAQNSTNDINRIWPVRVRLESSSCNLTWDSALQAGSIVTSGRLAGINSAGCSFLCLLLVFRSDHQFFWNAYRVFPQSSMCVVKFPLSLLCVNVFACDIQINGIWIKNNHTKAKPVKNKWLRFGMNLMRTKTFRPRASW